MDDHPSVRIRRLPDERRMLGRRARYEVEQAGSPSVETDQPSRVLGPLLGSGHPADLSTYTDAADLAWDGGTGQWRTGPRFWVEDGDPGTAPTADVADPEAVEGRAAAFVTARTRGSLVGTLTYLAALLDRLGHHEPAADLGAIGRDVMLARSPEDQAEIRRRVDAVWAEHRLVDLRPQVGSLTERAVVRTLLAQLDRLRADGASR